MGRSNSVLDINTRITLVPASRSLQRTQRRGILTVLGLELRKPAAHFYGIRTRTTLAYRAIHQTYGVVELSVILDCPRPEYDQVSAPFVCFQHASPPKRPIYEYITFSCLRTAPWDHVLTLFHIMMSERTRYCPPGRRKSSEPEIECASERRRQDSAAK